MTKLRRRKPTGQVAWPLVLLEGGEKTGKSHDLLSLSADDRVGTTFVFELGENTADEYAPLGDYEIVDTDGTYSDLLAQMTLATQEPMVDGKPNVIGLDTGSALWEAIKIWAENRARNSNAGKKALREDPDAEISVPMNIWTDANDRWGRLIHLLQGWEGIAVIVCRGRETAKVDGNGRPVQGQTDYRVEAHKSLPFASNAHIRKHPDHSSTLMWVRKVGMDVPAKGLALPSDQNPIAHVVFDILGAGSTFAASAPIQAQGGFTKAAAKNQLVELLTAAGASEPTSMAAELWAAIVPAETVDVTDALWGRLENAVDDVMRGAA